MESAKPLKGIIYQGNDAVFYLALTFPYQLLSSKTIFVDSNRVGTCSSIDVGFASDWTAAACFVTT